MLPRTILEPSSLSSAVPTFKFREEQVTGVVVVAPHCVAVVKERAGERVIATENGLLYLEKRKCLGHAEFFKDSVRRNLRRLQAIQEEEIQLSNPKTVQL